MLTARAFLCTAMRLCAFALPLINYTTAIDGAAERRRKRRLRAAVACSAAILASACAPKIEPPRTPEPAQVKRLDCGGKTCAITESAGVTVIWVSE